MKSGASGTAGSASSVRGEKALQPPRLPACVRGSARCAGPGCGLWAGEAVSKTLWGGTRPTVIVTVGYWVDPSTPLF